MSGGLDYLIDLVRHRFPDFTEPSEIAEGVGVAVGWWNEYGPRGDEEAEELFELLTSKVCERLARRRMQ